ncbi:aminoglycoside phosphotransferase family protein [Microbacterium abyssi]|uniref:aminoglycoside phosphotransferase family protein n=1 Tax=Microbacterium abyssi TaxID=2782166 RepID=UPI001887B59C|nr:aminoglycoside phosphotransferase family protein [Microbacterium sp. A18JL241]
MHADQIDVDERTARRLIVEQFPQWRAEPLRWVGDHGTVNAIFRIGEHHAARFPLNPAAPAEVGDMLVREAAAMSELAAVSPVPTPVPFAIGAPGPGYPLPWSIQTWIPGEEATPDAASHSPVFARDLAQLVLSLRRADTGGRPFSGRGRGGDLRDSDEWMATCFEKSEGMLPVPELRDMWARMRELPDASGLAMTHGDLIPGNLVLDGDRLAGVLDGGGFGPADPSLDLVAAWHLLDADARTVFREELDADDLEWNRGAAWALQQAMGLVWYYVESNPPMSALGRNTLRRLLVADDLRER